MLDRASDLRKSPGWLAQQWGHPDCQVMLLHNDKNLMHCDHDQAPVALYHSRQDIKFLTNDTNKVVFLGLNETTPLFAVEIEISIEAYFEGQENLKHDEQQFIDVRQLGCLLNAQDAAVLAYARGLLFWNRNSLFCSRCGAPTIQIQGGHAKHCSNDSCGHLTFPRTDPAVIMLIEDYSNPDQPRCLLGRNAKFPNRMMSTLAGFVDPSESLEETVVRESFEEAGIRVGEVAYQASQPWPFPSSIMLGFRALATTTDITIDGVEIEEAGWFTVEQLMSFGEWGDDDENYCLPRRDSIARYLIECWIRDVTKSNEASKTASLLP
ncbi:MAG: NAD+ diphosphatase [Urechidicola sp.]